MMKTFETFLPIFPGFYNTYLEEFEERQIELATDEEGEYTEETFFDESWDWINFHNEIAKDFTKKVEEKINEEAPQLNKTMKNTTQAKTYTLSGKVVNAQGQAVANAQITVLSAANMAKTKTKNKTMKNKTMNNSSNSKTAKTNKKGQFTIDNVSSGAYTVKVEADGYQISKQKVTITKDKTLTITLQPSQQ